MVDEEVILNFIRLSSAEKQWFFSRLGNDDVSKLKRIQELFSGKNDVVEGFSEQLLPGSGGKTFGVLLPSCEDSALVEYIDSLSVQLAAACISVLPDKSNVAVYRRLSRRPDAVDVCRLSHGITISPASKEALRRCLVSAMETLEGRT